MRASFLAVALVAALPYLSAAATDAPECAQDRIHFITGEGPISFDIELAKTPSEQSLGLMFRSSLPDDAGMLFIFGNPRPASFWMKNTMIPLDMIFIDDAGLVANIAAETEPYSLAPHGSEGAVRAVLEINGGQAAAPFSCIAAE